MQSISGAGLTKRRKTLQKTSSFERAQQRVQPSARGGTVVGVSVFALAAVVNLIARAKPLPDGPDDAIPRGHSENLNESWPLIPCISGHLCNGHGISRQTQGAVKDRPSGNTFTIDHEHRHINLIESSPITKDPMPGYRMHL